MKSNSREVRYAIKGGMIEVNGKVVREEKYPIGFGDVVHIVPISESYKDNLWKAGHL